MIDPDHGRQTLVSHQGLEPVQRAGKLAVGLLINMDKLVGKQVADRLVNLKVPAEAKAKR
jgi:hypothetical protein